MLSLGGVAGKLFASRPSHHDEPDSGVWLVRTSAPPRGQRRRLGAKSAHARDSFPTSDPKAGASKIPATPGQGPCSGSAGSQKGVELGDGVPVAGRDGDPQVLLHEPVDV